MRERERERRGGGSCDLLLLYVLAMLKGRSAGGNLPPEHTHRPPP